VKEEKLSAEAAEDWQRSQKRETLKIVVIPAQAGIPRLQLLKASAGAETLI